MRITKEKGFNIICCMIILCVGFQYIGDTTIIKVLGDEFGYWTSAAWITGKDWSSVASFNSYFGFGYGFILAPIMLCFSNPIIQYRVAIGINVFFLVCVFEIIVKILENIFQKKAGIKELLLALTVTLYAGNVYYTQYTMSETVALLIYWLLVYLLLLLWEKFDIKKGLVYIVLLAYLFCLHQRMIGIIFVSIIFWIGVCIHHRKYKECIVSVIIFGILFVGVIHLKDIYKDLYLLGNGGNVSNDIEGQIDKIKFLFSKEGIKSFAICMLGKLYYAFSSTYLVLIFLVTYIVKKIRESKKQKKIEAKLVIAVYSITCTLAMMAIASVFMIHYEQRYDFMIYGRYFDFTISTLLLFALIEMLNISEHNWNYIFAALGYGACAVALNQLMPFEMTTGLNFNCPGILWVNNMNYSLLEVSTGVIIIYLVILYLFMSAQSLRGRTYLLLTFIFLGIGISHYAYTDIMLPWSKEVAEKEQNLTDYILKNSDNRPVYFICAGNQNCIDWTQYLLQEVPIKCVRKGQVDSIPDDAYVITVNEIDQYIDSFSQKYEPVAESAYQKLWLKIEQ